MSDREQSRMLGDRVHINKLATLQALQEESPFAHALALPDSLNFANKVERLSVAVAGFNQFGSIARMERAMRHRRPESSSRGETIKGLGQRVNMAPYLTLGQLQAVANADPYFGYFSSNLGITRSDDEGIAISAFTTPLSTDREYAVAYGKAVSQAHRKLETESPFTFSDPFTVVLAGDGEGVMLGRIIEQLLLNQVDFDAVEFVSVDISKPLLDDVQSKIAEGAMRIQFRVADARQLGEVLQDFSNRRGVIVTEELIDDFPCPFVGHDPKNGDLFEEVLTIENPQESDYRTTELDQELTRLTKAWLSAFPYYRDHFTKAYHTDSPITSVNLNTGLLSMIDGITKSGFRGYWIGGDYSESYRILGPHQRSSAPQASVYLPGGEHAVDLICAIDSVANLTADVDPVLLSYAQARGMRSDFLGRMGHFMGTFLASRLVSVDDVKEALRAIPDDIRHTFSDQSESDMRACLDVQKLARYYSGNRTNWVYSQGDVPPLVEDPQMRHPW